MVIFMTVVTEKEWVTAVGARFDLKVFISPKHGACVNVRFW